MNSRAHTHTPARRAGALLVALGTERNGGASIFFVDGIQLHTQILVNHRYASFLHKSTAWMAKNGMSEHDTCMVGAAEAWRGERPRPRRLPDRASASGLLTYAEAGEANMATRVAINIDARIIISVL